MKIFGLTGGSGAGKGLAAAIFQKFAIPSVDTDAVYHEMLKTKNLCTAELTATFGSMILSSAGGIDRNALRAAVFVHKNTPERLHTLNTITHKYIMAETEKMLQEYKKSGMRAALVDAPLLFEAGADRICDLVIGVIADRPLRIARIVARDGISEKDAEKRLDAQHDDAYFKAHCDVILYNNGTPAELEMQIGEFIMKYVVLS